MEFLEMEEIIKMEKEEDEAAQNFLEKKREA